MTKTKLRTEITNWKELTGHFGMEKAKELSRKLSNGVNQDDFIDAMAVSYDLGFYATFSLVKRDGDILHYQFTGTAG